MPPNRLSGGRRRNGFSQETNDMGCNIIARNQNTNTQRTVVFAVYRITGCYFLIQKQIGGHITTTILSDIFELLQNQGQMLNSTRVTPNTRHTGQRLQLFSYLCNSSYVMLTIALT